MKYSKKELISFLPNRPYVSNNFMNGLQVRPREKAIKWKYIELNPPHLRRFITFDVDHDQREILRRTKSYKNYKPLLYDPLFDYGVQEPYWTVINRENGHAHFIYVLKKPVLCCEMAHLRPLRYLKRIVDVYTAKIKADPRYRGLISKNPFNKKAWDIWTPLYHKQKPYTLAELIKGNGVDININANVSYAPVDEDIAGLGRNCYVFEHVRVRAYRERRNFWNKSYNEWRERVTYMCEEENANFSEPLGQAEINQIAKSITNWTFGEITPKGFSDYQRARVKLRWSRESLKKEGLELLEDGYSNDEIAEVLDVSLRTIQIWKQDLTKSILDKQQNPLIFQKR